MSNHLSTVMCCTHKFTPADIRSKLMTQREALGTNDQKLYGGNAKWFARAVCPDCERSYLLWLMPVPRGYKVLTISAVEQPEHDTDDIQIDLETATKDQLRAFLKQRNVSFFNGASEEQLRELAAGQLAMI